ncbi:SUN domain-containing protein 2 [Alligator sinensis]|uniref:SUN domain-containing protein 2 n=1 Tax=Alligator sinensis TaxID=38654 RepID=A0A1U7S280_ALLSI|nr:SUN domain-containing protein 2 [Alligator sinensis]XP_006029901.1 SUN domain-containing protein 2 [Alligator sinensis]XP_025067112.1 SUN domain-containing protein 2 [Alligator sinensis]
MSQRSRRLRATRYDQGDEDGTGSSSGVSSLLGGQQVPFKDSTTRNLRKKSSSMKRLSPAPTTQTSYYSESVVSESYLGSGRGFSVGDSTAYDDPLDSESYWGRELPVRRRRGTGDTESSKINGLAETKIYDTYASSSGYSSEDDYAGHQYTDQSSSRSGFRSAASQVGSFLWLVITSPGRIFGLFYWWIGTMWYRLTTMASLLDVFVLTRRYSALKKLLLLLLLLLLLASIAYGTWYFYPFGLPVLYSSMSSWGAAKISTPIAGKVEVSGAGDLAAFDQSEHHILSRLQALEKRFKALEAEASRLEGMELQRGVVAGGGLSHDDIRMLLEGLVSRREAALKKDFHKELDLHVQNKLDTIQAKLQKDLNGYLEKITQDSQDMEARMLQLNSDWQSLTKEGLTGNFLQEVGKLEMELAGLRKEIKFLTSEQQAVVKHVESLPGQIKGVRDDVEAQLPLWIEQFLSQPRKDDVGSLFLQREELQDQLQEMEHRILAKISEDQQMSAQDARASVRVALQQGGVMAVTEEEVHLIVNRALKRYSEDRIGMVDYALESAGASVINTRCSETYERKTALLSLFGIPLWYNSQSPRAILQPDVHPGNCWAFRGTLGFAVIRLSSRICPTAVTLEHISKSLSPMGTIPSAPKDFAIYGLEEEGQEEGILLGRFMYDQEGDPIQTFHFTGEDLGVFQVVELKVLSNWGHPEYTCIYRFRVHGEPAH